MIQKMEGNPPTPPQREQVDDEQELSVDDAVEIIELEEGDGLDESVDGLDLQDGLNGEEGDITDQYAYEEDETEAIDDMEIEDDSKISLQKHSGSVFSVSLNPADQSMAISGGEDDKAFLWNLEGSELIKEIGGHKDSVTFVEFSNNGKYFVTADMGGAVQVWTVTDLSLKWSFEFSDIEWLKWHPVAIVLFIGTVDGDIYMTVPSGDCKILSGGGHKTTAGYILPNGKQLFAGYENGNLVLWDLKSTAQIFSLKGDNGHQDTVNCVASSSNNSLLVSGSYDATVKVLSASNGKILSTFDAGFPQGDKNSENTSVECVSFSNDTLFVLSGSLSGVLAIWDISAQRLRHDCKHPIGAGITKLMLDPSVVYHVFTGALDGVIRLWDIRSGECLRQWCGHRDAILDFRITKDGQKIISASDDGTVKVFEV